MTEEVVAPEDMSFGAALEELERIVRGLESGQLELEESLESYERGVALLRACQAKLSSAEQRVTMLIGELESDTPASADVSGADGKGADIE
jgi:exodeoxyribonuclease VII small subunit